ncbi:DUF1707 SHOCT-like domain-containing protein [Nocardia sp. bgisy134]|uniref:DUF1707 SHOCT-like domain-containing protein n=1 Tax=Nocardia sp. bgisy134 TaxID=3413789 RepID=UPI003D73EED3
MASKTARLRASDSDRADVCGLLDAALADGQLTESEHTARTGIAMRAKSFGDLDKLIDDLQIPGELVDAPVVRGGRGRTRWIPAVILAAALIAGGLVGCVAHSAVDRAVADPLPDLTTGAGLAYFIDRYRAEFGDTVADDVTVYPRYALFYRNEKGKSVYYHFDGDFSLFGNPSSRKPDTPTVDMGAIDLPILARLLAGASQSVLLPGSPISHVSIEREDKKGAQPYVQIYVQNEMSETGFMTVLFDGEPLNVRPPNR